MYPIITAKDLNQRRHDPEQIIIDANWYLPNQDRCARTEYHESHIPKAGFFDIDECCDKNSPLPHTLPSPQSFQASMQKLGVNNNSRITVYDHMGYFSAPRLRWMLHYFGHSGVTILDGGLQAWKQAGLPLEQQSPPRQLGNFTSLPTLPASQKLADKNDILGMLQKPDAKPMIIDARPKARFRGEAPEPRREIRAGHIPKSINIPYDEFSHPHNGHFKNKTQLTQLIATKITLANKHTPIICSCGSGITACVAALGLEILGYDNVRIYDGSWAEWGSDKDLPINTGHGRSGRI